MGFLRKVGGFVKKAAPFAAFIPGVGPIAAGALGLAGGALASKGNLKQMVGGALGGAMGGMGGGAAGALGGGLKKMDLLQGALGVGAGLLGARQQGKADKMARRALQMREQQYADFAPVRKLGLQGLQNQQRPDLGGVYRDPNNPFG